MAGWSARLKKLFAGGASKKNARRKTPAPQSPKRSPEDGARREALIKEAMAVYRSRRSEARGLLERTLKEMREKPPKAVSEHDDLVRLLELRRAHVILKSLMGHDLKRYLVLSGVRGLLEDAPQNRGTIQAPDTSKAAKPPRRVVTKR